MLLLAFLCQPNIGQLAAGGSSKLRTCAVPQVTGALVDWLDSDRPGGRVHPATGRQSSMDLKPTCAPNAVPPFKRIQRADCILSIDADVDRHQSHHQPKHASDVRTRRRNPISPCFASDTSCTISETASCNREDCYPCDRTQRGLPHTRRIWEIQTGFAP